MCLHESNIPFDKSFVASICSARLPAVGEKAVTAPFASGSISKATSNVDDEYLATSSADQMTESAIENDQKSKGTLEFADDIDDGPPVFTRAEASLEPLAHSTSGLQSFLHEIENVLNWISTD
ncbi:uncharacterized protein ASCRUDRAFT_69604 [Ascoidea rubescens DSM 1968]|uniref:Uncharacterized protein n=1 Tax=Ascoidea rubescens DSM 1968 TaxID=1344418 RepID=A0A1D2VJU1_9ASCO|nr:hypothetical protein ASCRUDRAFT_69604 [Ascoidea rubescens DSM 1968]ODV61885.1 hypothetical protein ASCRUDRAFT_69604 [Ascoidea rubescens DSM 1968]